MIRWMLVAAMTSLVTACGFQLRGQAALDSSLATANLSVSPANPQLTRELRQLLGANGVTLSESDAEPQISVDGVQVEQQIQSVGAGARVREFALIQRATLSVQSSNGDVMLAPRNLEIRRDYTFDEQQALGIAAEEEVIREELLRDMARRILLELEAVGR